MAVKILMVLAMTVVGLQSQAVTEHWLQDQTTSHVSNPMIPKSIGIGRLVFDTQISCHIILPSGVMYELFPNAQIIPHASIISAVSGSVEPFSPGCGVFFRNPPTSLSGTYELMSLVEHTYTDSSRTLYRQRYHITFTTSDVVWPAKGEVQEEGKPTNA